MVATQNTVKMDVFIVHSPSAIAMATIDSSNDQFKILWEVFRPHASDQMIHEHLFRNLNSSSFGKVKLIICMVQYFYETQCTKTIAWLVRKTPAPTGST